MAAEQSMWHVNDVVAYDLMREASTTVQARLIELACVGDTTATDELVDIRRTTLAVDGYDRAAVDAYTRQLQQRDSELARSAADGG
jgi:hypothetical protein